MANLVRVGSKRVATLSRAVSTTAAKKSEVAATGITDVASRDRIYPKLGNRDVVGFGFNGYPTYYDKQDFPCPAVRFGENTPEVLALRAKEAGDWKQLSLDEKKALYRASFRQTYAEMDAPSGEWKSVFAACLLGLSITGWMMIWLKQYVYPELPSTITEEWKIDQAKQMIIQRQGPIDGLASKFDYENNKWK